MVPRLRKRIWYQRYVGDDEVTSYRLLFRKCCTDASRRPHADQGGGSGGGSGGGKRNGLKKSWQRRVRRCDSHESESDSSDDETRNREIKMEDVDDMEELPGKKKNALPSLDSASKCQGRMLMREWLEVNANVGRMSGLKWLDKDLGLVQIAWKHGSRAGWNRSDVEVFESWALHTGKLNPNKSDCKRWKANFRCALNSLPDVIEIKERCNVHSRNPYKVYRLLPPHHVTKQSRLKKVKSSDGYISAHLSACSDESNVKIKEEPVDQEIPTLPKPQICHPIETTPSIASSETQNHDEVRIWNTVEASTPEDPMFEQPGFHRRTRSTDDPQTQETVVQQTVSSENSIRHNDHSYANVLEEVNAEELKILEEPGLVDGRDLISTINEELAKFCSSNYGVDFWSEEASFTTKFILHDVVDSGDFDDLLL